MSFGKAITVDVPFEEAVAKVRGALKDEGFGVLTEIDVTATMREKLGADIEDYVILGACNPPLAYSALGVDRSIGLLLPCNVVVRAGAGRTVVGALDPQDMVQLTGLSELLPIADEAASRLDRVLAALA